MNYFVLKFAVLGKGGINSMQIYLAVNKYGDQFIVAKDNLTSGSRDFSLPIYLPLWAWKFYKTQMMTH